MPQKNKKEKIIFVIKKIWFLLKLIFIGILVLPWAIIDVIINLLRAGNRSIMVLIGFASKHIDKRIYLSFVARLFKI